MFKNLFINNTRIIRGKTRIKSHYMIISTHYKNSLGFVFYTSQVKTNESGLFTLDYLIESKSTIENV